MSKDDFEGREVRQGDKTHILTKDGFEKLQLELEDLKNNKRPEISERIKSAMALGDITENAEYEEAKKDQAFIEGRIQYLESILTDAQVIDESDVDHSEVNIGCKVALVNLDTNTDLTVTIVGSYEAKPEENKISNVSPLGQELLGHAPGDIVRIKTPSGPVKYRIIKIRRA
jgi:transcription elongation factor GreA